MDKKSWGKERIVRRRNEIVAMAVNVFAKNGYRRTKVEEIAHRLGIAKGTIYQYFKSKKELFLAMSDQGLKFLRDVILQKIKDAASPLDKIKAGVDTYLSFFQDHKGWVEILVQERAEFRKYVEATYLDHYKKNIGRLEGVFREGVKEGIFRPLNPKTAIETLAALLHGTVYMHMLKRKKTSLVNSGRKILDVFFNGVLLKEK